MSDIILYPGCLIQSRLPFLEAAAKFILDKLNVKTDEPDGLTCCMEPVGLRSLGPETWLGVGARIHSIASGRKILTLCDGCGMSLTEAADGISKDTERAGTIMKEIGRTVKISEVTSMLEFLHSNLSKIKENLVTEIDFNLAVFPGCHSESVCASKGISAKEMMSDIVKALGGNPILLRENLCCGGGLAGVEPEIEKKVMHESISLIRNADAIAVVTSCPFCFLQFDMIGRQTTLHITELVASGMGWQEDAHRHHHTK